MEADKAIAIAALIRNGGCSPIDGDGVIVALLEEIERLNASDDNYLDAILEMCRLQPID